MRTYKYYFITDKSNYKKRLFVNLRCVIRQNFGRFSIVVCTWFLLAIAAYKFKLLKEFLEPVMTMLKQCLWFVCNNALIWVGNQALTNFILSFFNRIADDIHEYACGT